MLPGQKDEFIKFVSALCEAAHVWPLAVSEGQVQPGQAVGAEGQQPPRHSGPGRRPAESGRVQHFRPGVHPKAVSGGRKVRTLCQSLSCGSKKSFDRKFDIGLYVMMTSINPLRVYILDSDALLRFCAKPYHPFNSTDLDSYVVGDHYTPVWQVCPHWRLPQMTDPMFFRCHPYRNTSLILISIWKRHSIPIWGPKERTRTKCGHKSRTPLEQSIIIKRNRCCEWRPTSRQPGGRFRWKRDPLWLAWSPLQTLLRNGSFRLRSGRRTQCVPDGS